MVRNIVVLGGSSHPELTAAICDHLSIAPAQVILDKFANGETRVEIKESVRGKDVYIIQSGSGMVNDNLMELLIMISACKTASAKKVTAVLPFFPYSRQSEIPYNKTGAPLHKAGNPYKPWFPYSVDTAPQTPQADSSMAGFFPEPVEHSSRTGSNLSKTMSNLRADNGHVNANGINGAHDTSSRNRSDTVDSVSSTHGVNGHASTNGTHHENGGKNPVFQPQPGYKIWVAQSGTLVANLLTCAGADHVITMELHDAQYQGFFDIPVDNLYGRPLLKRYISEKIPDYKNAVIVSPDAGGAKRATAIADELMMPFALIHKERRPTKITDRQNATMMLVGDVADRVAILIDDMADTANTVTRAARLLKKEGATAVYALITHGVLSGGAIERINKSDIDRIVVTNSVPQREHERCCSKLRVLHLGYIFSEAIRRVHHGESISTLFTYD